MAGKALLLEKEFKKDLQERRGNIPQCLDTRVCRASPLGNFNYHSFFPSSQKRGWEGDSDEQTESAGGRSEC